MQAILNSTSTTTKPYLPSIKFLLNSPVEMFKDHQIPVEPRNPSNSYINTSPRKLPSLPTPSVSPVERNIDSMTGYHLKGNQYQDNLLRLPSIGQIGQIEPNNNNNNINNISNNINSNSNSNNNRNITSITVAEQKHSRPNSIQSLLSPPVSPDMANNPFNNDYTSHVTSTVATTEIQQQQQQQQQPQQRPRLAHPQHTEYHYSSNVPSLMTSNAPSYHQSYATHQDQRGYDRVGGYRQDRVVYDRAYTEQHRAYPSSNTSPSTLQPAAFYPYESRPVSAPTTLPRLDISAPVLNRRLSAPITTSKMIHNDQLTSPISGGSPSNNNSSNRYQCPYCSKRFSRPSSLRIHTYSHTGEKPFVCTEPGCGRKFSVQSNMRRHLRVHRLGRPVKKVRYDGEVEGVKMLNHGAIMRNC